MNFPGCSPGIRGDLVCPYNLLLERSLVGLQIIKGLKKDGDEFGGGKILDPDNGKLYKCYITLEDVDTLKVRGYIGFSLFGRTQYWYRAK